MNVIEIQSLSNKIIENVAKVIIGKENVIHNVVLSLFASGHVLLEDMPGTGKTTLAKALAKSLDCNFKRVQFTPDLLPSDLTGINFYNQKLSEFIFKQGPIFTNILLADEINRATPRTQSSLLECMEEGQISVDSITYQLEKPFFVIATQNPIETQGTFPLPEAQLDRFFMKLSVGYPDKDYEISMLNRFILNNPYDELKAVVTKQQLINAQQSIKNIHVSDAIKSYIIEIVTATRTHKDIRLGVSPRGAIAIMKAAQVEAAFDGRNYVTPDDVKKILPSVISHRIIGKRTSNIKLNNDHLDIIKEILETTPVPTETIQ